MVNDIVTNYILEIPRACDLVFAAQFTAHDPAAEIAPGLDDFQNARLMGTRHVDMR